MPVTSLSFGSDFARATIRLMKRILAAAMFLTVFACPLFAAKHSHPHHQRANYRYKAPKSFKAHIHKHKEKHHHSA